MLQGDTTPDCRSDFQRGGRLLCGLHDGGSPCGHPPYEDGIPCGRDFHRVAHVRTTRMKMSTGAWNGCRDVSDETIVWLDILVILA